MAWDGDLEPLRPEDSISCVGEEGFKSRRRDSPLFDGRYGRNRVRVQPPPPLKVIDSWTKPASSHQRAAALPRSKPKTTTTTTTTRTVQYREPVRYEAFLPLRPSQSRKHSSSKHSSSKHSTTVEREPYFSSSSSKKSTSRAPPPRSNDRFYEYRREEPVTSRGRTVAASLDAGRRTTCVAPRSYSQDRGSGSGVYSAFGLLRGSSRDRGSLGGYEHLRSKDESRCGSRRLSYVGTTHGDTKGDHRGYGLFRRH